MIHHSPNEVRGAPAPLTKFGILAARTSGQSKKSVRHYERMKKVTEIFFVTIM
jgi:hypothetical protein